MWQKCNTPELLEKYEALEKRVIALNKAKKYLTGEEAADTVHAEVIKRVPVVACVENNLQNPQIITKYNKVASNASITATAIVSFIFVCIKQTHNLYKTYQLSKTSEKSFEQLSAIIKGFSGCSWVMPENDFTFTFTLVLEREFVKFKGMEIPTSVFLSILQGSLIENNNHIKVLRNSFNTLKISMEGIFSDEAISRLNQKLSDSIGKYHQQKTQINTIVSQLNWLHSSLSFFDISEWNEDSEAFEFRAYVSIYQLPLEYVYAIEESMKGMFANTIKIDIGKYFIVIELVNMVAVEPDIIKEQAKVLKQLFLGKPTKILTEKETKRELESSKSSHQKASSSRSLPDDSKIDSEGKNNIDPMQSGKSEESVATPIKPEVSAVFNNLLFVPKNTLIIPIENTKSRPNEKLYLYFDEDALRDYRLVSQFKKAVMASNWIIPEDGKQGVVRCGAEIFKIKKEGDPRLWGYIAYSTSVSGEQVKLIRICVVQMKHEEYNKAYNQVKHELAVWKSEKPNCYLAPKPSFLKRISYE